MIWLVILHKDDKKAIVLYAVGNELGLSIGINLNWRQVEGTTELLNKPLRMFSKVFVSFEEKFLLAIER